MRNHDAEHDFLHAKAKIEDIIWVRHIEMHVKASDWYNHKHQKTTPFKMLSYT